MLSVSNNVSATNASPRPRVDLSPQPFRTAANPSGLGDLEICPFVGERATSSSYDLVARVPYLFVRVLKAKHGGGADWPVYSEMVIGSHSVRTRTATTKSNDWDQVFAFHKGVSTPLACRFAVGAAVVNSRGSVDVMLAVWIGTQVDEAFQEAWQSDSGGGLNVHTRSKAYLSPKFWYLRLTVIQMQDLHLPPPADPKSPRPGGAGGPELFVKRTTHQQQLQLCQPDLE
ncbi:hypothetical protein ZIOFF_020323 [Zingiber officinale]|uniref:C2 domain-containing protein n=1 Tax=Zingiber officinale TaxID=94328 RepID=A0A8J5LIN5_ZINOF|nr:hypothetical protein ZIOFF_020323 [Zingiber officinale]